MVVGRQEGDSQVVIAMYSTTTKNYSTVIQYLKLVCSISDCMYVPNLFQSICQDFQ